MPEWVQADAKRLRQILLNLLGNAVRFTESGRIVLRVDARREVLRFEIEDTGMGIAPQDMDRIFLPFERGSGGRRIVETGTGLGLTITHLLTELMGGELTVRSQLDRGSTFTVRVYLREIAAPPQAPVAADGLPDPVGQRAIVGYEGVRRTLLVVDDQPIQRQMLAGMLMPLGFVIREAASGSEALEQVRSGAPDAVLLDISMDDMDGWATARAMRAGGARVPIIIVSANVFENRPDNLAAAGCQAFVVKPVMESELLRALGGLLALGWVTQVARTDELPLRLDERPWPPPPDDAAWELSRLARKGHIQALRDALQAWQASHPAHAPRWRLLQGWIDQFELDAVLSHLAPFVDGMDDLDDVQEDRVDEPQT